MRSISPGQTKLFLIVIFIPLGLLTKGYSGFGDEFVNKYFGGVIYVVFFVLLASLIFPHSSTLKMPLTVVFITCLIEFSQLIQVDFLNILRKSLIARSLIGSVFNVFDFIFYFVGGLISYGILELLKNENYYS